MDHERELARAIALGDCKAASVVLDLLVREERLDAHQVDLGRSDAARVMARNSGSPLRCAA